MANGFQPFNSTRINNDLCIKYETTTQTIDPRTNGSRYLLKSWDLKLKHDKKVMGITSKELYICFLIPKLSSTTET